jgi:hypothetical protein
MPRDLAAGFIVHCETKIKDLKGNVTECTEQDKKDPRITRTRPSPKKWPDAAATKPAAALLKL